MYGAASLPAPPGMRPTLRCPATIGEKGPIRRGDVLPAEDKHLPAVGGVRTAARQGEDIVARSWFCSRPRSCEAHQLCRPPPPQAQAAYDLLDLGQVGCGQARGGWPPRANAIQHGPRLSPPRHVDKDARDQHPERLGLQILLKQPIVRHVLILSRQSRNQRGDSIVRRCQSCREPDDGVAHRAL